MSEPRKITYGELELVEVEGHTTSPHYHQINQLCPLCKNQQAGLLMCLPPQYASMVEENRKAIECEKCTTNNLVLLGIDTQRCWVPQPKSI